MAKAKIEDVFMAFQRFQAEMVAVGNDVSPFRQPVEWQGRADAARDRLKLRLEELGLAEYIDWENVNG